MNFLYGMIAPVAPSKDFTLEKLLRNLKSLDTQKLKKFLALTITVPLPAFSKPALSFERRTH